MERGRKRWRNGMDKIKCPKCESMMEEGLFLDRIARSVYAVGSWLEGVPEQSWFSVWWSGLKIKGRRRLPITAYRCVTCGYVEFYAYEDRNEKPKRG
jgi:predicted nucleic-acid-binding Zn-ribbon protein